MRNFDSTNLLGKKINVSDGEYTLLQEIGGGGIGIVYKAQHKKEDKTICVKVLNPIQAFKLSDGLVERFFHEVSTAKRFKNNNLVQVFDVGKINDKINFYCMEYCEGGNLKNFLRKHPSLDFTHVCNIFFQICNAVNYIHDSGYIHRDLKPDNILLTQDYPFYDKSIEVKVSDYGTLYNLSNLLDNPVTHSNDVIGSLVYISPEQRLKKAVIQSDIYALGIILYQMLIRDTYEYRLKPLKAIPGLEDQEKLALQNIIYRMCENDLKFRYKSLNDVLIDIKNKVAVSKYLQENIDFPNFVKETNKSLALDFTSSNIYHQASYELYKYNGESWCFPDELSEYGYPTETVIKNDLVYAGWSSGFATCIFLSTGKKNWERQISDNSIVSTPVVITNKCIIIDEIGQLHCLNAFSGDTIWKLDLNKPCTCPLKIIAEKIYVICNSGYIYVIDPDSGGILKKSSYLRDYIKSPDEDKVYQIISSSEGLFFIKGADIIGIPDVNKIPYGDSSASYSWYCYCPYYDGASWWGPTNRFTGIGFDNRYLYATTNNGQVMCQDTETGTIIWVIETCENIYSPPFIFEDIVTVVSGMGYLYILDKNSGATLKRRFVGERSFSTRQAEDDYSGLPIYSNGYVLVLGKCEVSLVETQSFKKILRDYTGEDPRPLPSFSGNMMLISSSAGIQAFK